MGNKKTYNVTFKGYRLEEDSNNLPEYSGIYLAYRCVFNKETNKVSLSELVYIGKAENLKRRIMEHKQQADISSECAECETICYAYASVSLNELDIVENALIFAQKPRLNKTLKDHFNFNPASFVVEGTCSLLTYTNFTIS